MMTIILFAFSTFVMSKAMKLLKNCRNKMTNTETAQLAIEKLTVAIENKNKKYILSAYDLVENEAFEWNDVNRDLYLEWDGLIDKANDILYS